MIASDYDTIDVSDDHFVASGPLTLVARRNAYVPVGTINASTENEWPAAVDDSEGEYFTQERVLADFREGWHQVMIGKTRPVSELWSLLDE